MIVALQAKDRKCGKTCSPTLNSIAYEVMEGLITPTDCVVALVAISNVILEDDISTLSLS